ncbi:WD40 repeat-like protein [Sistotremastrum suecicum HHB10207 ss-3]|uniref:WD40 repeat-like protein n=1 Tax=Sistotremastrum suecicum HHB10207 ss-3 TaxID=1314776 RepID=A0A165WRP0_9AGAM|nr:WD40 repeat-like protein [Sistotremastrum suecicum HHB10207 ss-3]
MASHAVSTPRISHSAGGFRQSHLLPLPKEIKYLKISPNGKLLGVLDVDGLLRVWALETSEVIITVGTESNLPEEGPVTHFCWAQPYAPPFGVGLICAFEGGKMQTIEYRGVDPKDARQTWNSREAFQAHEGEITSLSIDSSHTYVFSVTSDQIRLWHMGPSWDMTHLATDSLELELGDRILSNSFFSGPCIWMPIATRVIRTWVIDVQGVRLSRAGNIKVPFDLRAIVVSPDERWLVALRSAGGGHLYSLPDFKHTKVVFGAHEIIESVSFVHGRHALIYSDRSGVIRLRDLSTVKDIGVLTHHKGQSIAGAISASMNGTFNIVVSATIRAAALEPPRIMVWTDSASIRPPVSDISAPMGMTPRTRLIILIIAALRVLFVFSVAKIAYEFGIIVGREKNSGVESGRWTCLLAAGGRFLSLTYGSFGYWQVAIIGGLSGFLFSKAL